jgi:aquaporin Z
MTTLLRRNWPEYLIEGWALGTFMLSAAVFTMLIEHPASPVRAAIADGDARRVIAGLCMGLTAVALIYSPWGRRSGAHMNPAVTLTFLRLARTKPGDAAFFVLAQFAGATLAVVAMTALAGSAFTEPPVSAVATVPGPRGAGVAFCAEYALSFGMMLAILAMSDSRFASCTGVVAGTLVAAYISVEAPLSGMSINPARSFASAAPAGMWTHLWIYFVAPPLGMLSAAEVWLAFGRRVGCAKLRHSADARCIHCGYEPPARAIEAAPLFGESTHV